MAEKDCYAKRKKNYCMKCKYRTFLVDNRSAVSCFYSALGDGRPAIIYDRETRTYIDRRGDDLKKCKLYKKGDPPRQTVPNFGLKE